MAFIARVSLLTVIAATAFAGGEQKYSFTLPVGSNSGSTYKLEGMGRITGIRIWDNGFFIYGMQVRYGDIWSGKAGIATGRMQVMDLYEDEYFIQVSGKFGHYIHYLHFSTNKGRFIIAGQPNGQVFNFYPDHYGAELRFLSGTFTRAMTGFSTHWGLVLDPYANGKGC